MRTLLSLLLIFFSFFAGYTQNEKIDNEISSILSESENLLILSHNKLSGSPMCSTQTLYFAIDTVTNKLVYAVKTRINYEVGGSISQVYIKDDKILKLVIIFMGKEGILRTSSYWTNEEKPAEIFVEGIPYFKYFEEKAVPESKTYYIVEDMANLHDDKFAHEMAGLIEYCRKNKLRIDEFVKQEILHLK